MKRRVFLGGLSTMALTALAGCSTENPGHFTTEPGRIDPEAINGSGYTLQAADKLASEEILKHLGDTGAEDMVSAEAYTVAYRHENLPQTITVLSTPSVDILGNEFNPLASAETEDILDMVAGQLRQGESDLSIESIEKADEYSFNTTLGPETMEVFNVEMQSSDWTVYTDVFIVIHEEDEAVLLTSAIVVRDIEGIPINREKGYEQEKEIALDILAQVDFPFDWSEFNEAEE